MAVLFLKQRYLPIPPVASNPSTIGMVLLITGLQRVGIVLLLMREVEAQRPVIATGVGNEEKSDQKAALFSTNFS
jgi:hypothetical protein